MIKRAQRRRARNEPPPPEEEACDDSCWGGRVASEVGTGLEHFEREAVDQRIEAQLKPKKAT
jgi:hypothetical protein